jgi:hypothetical protein
VTAGDFTHRFDRAWRITSQFRSKWLPFWLGSLPQHFYAALSIPERLERLSASLAQGRALAKETVMKYAMFIYEDETVYGPGKAGPKIQEIVSKHMAFTQQLGAKRVGGAGLKSAASATTVRTAGGRKSVHDGPFAEAKEQLGGFYIVEAADLDEAIEIAKKIPVLQDGSIEVRPLMGE